MKPITIFFNVLSILVCVFLFNFCSKKTPPIKEVTKAKTCFSAENYTKLHAFITEKQTKKKPFFEYNGYNIYAQKENISFKMEGFTLGRINLEKGIHSFAKDAQDNLRIISEVQDIFCKLLKEEAS